MAADLTTTNILLGIMAGVSVLQGMAVIALLLAGVLLFRGVLQAVRRLEEQQISPALSRANAILEDVKGVTATVREDVGRLDQVAEWLADLLTRGRRRRAPGPSTKVM